MWLYEIGLAMLYFLAPAHPDVSCYKQRWFQTCIIKIENEGMLSELETCRFSFLSSYPQTWRVSDGDGDGDDRFTDDRRKAKQHLKSNRKDLNRAIRILNALYDWRFLL